MSLSSHLADARMARWARLAAAGDAGAFRRLYDRLYPVVAAYVGRRIETTADVEDLTSRVFVRFVEHLPRYDAQRGHPRAWVLTMARNQVIDHLRTRRRLDGTPERLDVLADAAVAPDDKVAVDEALSRLREQVAALAPEDRELLSLRYGDGLPLREIAAMTDRSLDATKQRLSRAQRKLRSSAAPPTSPAKKAARYAL